MGKFIALCLLLVGNSAFATTECEGDLDYRTQECAMTTYDTIKGNGAKAVVTSKSMGKGGSQGSKYVIGKFQGKTLKCTADWSAGGRSESAECEVYDPKLMKTILNDVMIKAAVRQARAFGETCSAKILSVDAAGEMFEAEVNCGVSATEVTGGGIVLMINIKGRAFPGALENVTITVQKAG